MKPSFDKSIEISRFLVNKWIRDTPYEIIDLKELSMNIANNKTLTSIIKYFDNEVYVYDIKDADKLPTSLHEFIFSLRYSMIYKNILFRFQLGNMRLLLSVVGTDINRYIFYQLLYPNYAGETCSLHIKENRTIDGNKIMIDEIKYLINNYPLKIGSAESVYLSGLNIFCDYQKVIDEFNRRLTYNIKQNEALLGMKEVSQFINSKFKGDICSHKISNCSWSNKSFTFPDDILDSSSCIGITMKFEGILSATELSQIFANEETIKQQILDYLRKLMIFDTYIVHMQKIDFEYKILMTKQVVILAETYFEFITLEDYWKTFGFYNLWIENMEKGNFSRSVCSLLTELKINWLKEDDPEVCKKIRTHIMKMSIKDFGQTI